MEDDDVDHPDPLKFVPPEYQEFADVFSKTPTLPLPPSHPFDHTIDLKDNVMPGHGLIYSLSEPEHAVLKEFIDDHLATGTICHSVDGVLVHACSLDGLWLIHDNYPSSIPVFYNILDTVRIFLGYDKINSVRSDFLEYPIQYKKVGYCWGNCHESTIIHPKNQHKIALHPCCVGIHKEIR